jgi:predicted branched-subunit amino acid permease
MAELRDFSSKWAAFAAGMRSAWFSVFFLVLGGTYIGLGALAHDFGFTVWWLTASTIIIWAAPAQLILISTLGTGAALLEIAIAVSLSAVRLFPMVVALLPLVRPAMKTKGDYALVTHFTSVSMWVESLHLLPGIKPEFRLAFCHGLSVSYMATAVVFGLIGFYLAAGLPPLFAAALLFLTPMSFLTSTARNCREMIDILAFIFGIVLGPLLAWYQIGLDLLWTGVLGGGFAYGIHRLREALT